MNNWILPHIQKDIDELKREDAFKKSEQIEKDLIEHLPSPNYVLIDAALWGDEIEELFASKTIYRSLFRGSTGLELWSVAPYLVDISSNLKIIELIGTKHPIDRRVTWLHSNLNIDELRKHLRRFLRLKQGDGNYIYFRFYDPYVIDAVFPNLEEEQVVEFFRGLNYLRTNDVRIDEINTYFLQQGELKVITQ